MIEGEAELRVGEETRPVRPGDLIFIPRDTVHGPILEKGKKLAALSVYAPFFDRGKQNIDREQDNIL